MNIVMDIDEIPYAKAYDESLCNISIVNGKLQAEGAFTDFIRFINSTLTLEWERLAHEEIDLVFPKVSGKIVTYRDFILTRGIPINSLMELFANYPDPKLHLGFALKVASLMESEDLETRKYAAMYAFQVFIPIAKIYKASALSCYLEDKAFEILDPKGFNTMLSIWRESFGYRLSLSDLQKFLLSIETELNITLKNDFDIENNLIKVYGRQKSILSFTDRFLRGRDIAYDRLGVTCVLKENIVESNLEDEENIHNILINKVFKSLIYRFGANITYWEDTFNNERSSASKLKAIITNIQLGKAFLKKFGSFFKMPFELRLTTEAHYFNALTTHSLYKVVETFDGNTIRPQYGSNFEDIEALTEYALFLKTQELGLEKNSGLSDLSRTRIRETLLRAKQASLKTRQGNHLLYISENTSTVDAIKQFILSINPSAMKAVDACEVLFQNDERYRIFFSDTSFSILKSIDNSWIKFEGIIELLPNTVINILEEVDDEYFNIFTIDDLLEMLSQEEISLEDIKFIQKRFFLMSNEKLEGWKGKLRSINSRLITQNPQLIKDANIEYSLLKEDIKNFAIRKKVLLKAFETEDPDRNDKKAMRKFFQTHPSYTAEILMNVESIYKFLDILDFNDKNKFKNWKKIYFALKSSDKNEKVIKFLDKKLEVFKNSSDCKISSLIEDFLNSKLDIES